MNNQIFRKKSIEKFSSPEQLNDYIRVSNPGVWMILGAIILLLAGVCVWGVFGSLDTRLTAAMVVSQGEAVCYVSQDDISKVAAGMPVECDGKEYTVTEIAAGPEAADASFGDYFFHVSGLSEGEWVYQVKAGQTDLEDGVYQAEITVESVSPMSFVTN